MVIDLIRGGITKRGNRPGNRPLEPCGIVVDPVDPNLLMHEVAKRGGRADADPLDAARARVMWMVANLDWEAPLVTKGQRMSEHRTIPGMAMFLRLHPDDAPAGLREKISEWAEVAIRRSDNPWDFRKLTDDGDWTPSGNEPTKEQIELTDDGGTSETRARADIGVTSDEPWKSGGRAGRTPAEGRTGDLAKRGVVFAVGSVRRWIGIRKEGGCW